MGVPTFDPRPFLDNTSRRIYESPLAFRKEVPPEISIPRVQVRTAPGKRLGLLQALDRSSRLSLIPSSEVRTPYRNGLFAVAKDEARDRLVLDARAANLAEGGVDPWIQSLGSLEQLQHIYVPPTHNLEVFCEDLREFYHAFLVSEDRCHRNALAMTLTRAEARSLACCSRGSAKELLTPCLRTLAMGDSHAVGFGQTSHLAVVLRCSELKLRDFVTLRGRPPRSPQLVAGLLIDDLLLLDFVAKVRPERPSRGLRIAESIRAGYDSAGLPRHAGKAVSGASSGEFWGGFLDGSLGILKPNPKRVVPLAALIVRILRSRVCCGGLLEALGGALVSALQMRRRLLCLLDAVYSEQAGREANDAFFVSGALASELLCCACLLCLSEVDLRAEGCPRIVCSDASSTAEAAVCCPVPPAVSVEFCRHGLQKGLWNRLLGEVPAYLRERGDYELAASELPESRYDHHPMWESVCCFLQFEQLGRVVCTHRRRHINIGELRAALRAEDLIGNRWPGTRYLHLLDSQVATACLVKGRSSSSSLNRELRRSLASHLSLKTQPRFGFVRSKFNPSDDPTRATAVRSLSTSAPHWWNSACAGDFAQLDSWLAGKGLHLDQLRELPPERELMPDASVSLPADDPKRRERRVRSPEELASKILQRASVSAADLMLLFSRLPVEISRRSVLESKRGSSFSAGAFVHGGVVGLRKSCYEFPRSVRAFALYARQMHPGVVFSSLSVLRNTRSLPHRDSHNLRGEPNLIIPLSKFRGGAVWIETEGGSVAIPDCNRTEVGELLEVCRGPRLLDPSRLHATMSWSGDRCVLVTYAVRDLHKLSEPHHALLESLGFRLPSPGHPEDSPEHGSEWTGDAPAQVPCPLSADDLRKRFEISPILDRGSSAASASAALDFTKDFASGSSPDEPRACASGSLRVEPSSFIPDQICNPRLRAPQAGLASDPPGLAKGVFELLSSLPPGRFVFSGVFPDLRSALLSGPGWLDLFSGSRGVAREIARAAPCWVLCYDLLHDEDLLNFATQKEIMQLVTWDAFRGLSAGPVCSSFSCAITPPWRSRTYPAGIPGLLGRQYDKVREGNAMLEFLLNLVEECERRQMIYLIENPLSSWMWSQPAWSKCSSRRALWDFLVDFCVFGTPWKKATRFRTNGQLGGQRMRCSRDHSHRILRGRDRETGRSLTKSAEPYPRRLCVLIAQCACQDVGWIDNCRPFDISRCAKCTNARIGEASNPGPPKARKNRPNVVLSEVPLVQPATAALQRTVWTQFVSWVSVGAGAEASAAMLSVPEILVEMLCAYGQVLYSKGGPLQHYRQLLATAQRRSPLCKPLMKPAWEMLSRWERLEPVQHRPPMPEPLFEAMCSLGLCLGWERWVCATMLCFYGCCRIGEVLRATRDDLQTPADLLRGDNRFFLKISEPKSRNRGPRVQHSTLVLPEGIGKFITRTCDKLHRSSPLYHGSPAVYRKRWDCLLERLGVARTLRITPGSLRGGGAVAAYQGGLDISSLQWKMRLQHQSTLGFYLQEVAAGSILPLLPRHSREAIEAARAVFPFHFDSAQRSNALPSGLNAS